MWYKVITVDVNGGQNQAGHEHHQAKRQTAEAVEGGLFGPQRQNQFFLILDGKRTQIQILILETDTERQTVVAQIIHLPHDDPIYGTPKIAAHINDDAAFRAAAGGSQTKGMSENETLSEMVTNQPRHFQSRSPSVATARPAHAGGVALRGESPLVRFHFEA